MVVAAVALLVVAAIPTGIAAAAAESGGPHTARVGAGDGGMALADVDDNETEPPCEDWDLNGDGIYGGPEDCAPVAIGENDSLPDDTHSVRVDTATDGVALVDVNLNDSDPPCWDWDLNGDGIYGGPEDCAPVVVVRNNTVANATDIEAVDPAGPDDKTVASPNDTDASAEIGTDGITDDGNDKGHSGDLDRIGVTRGANDRKTVQPRDL